MEEYIIRKSGVTGIKQGKFCEIVRNEHIASYGEHSADNIRSNSVKTYISIMEQLQGDVNHNSLLVGKVQSGKTSNLELITALAFDNGYDFLVILGGYDKDLVGQTTKRYGETFHTKGGDDGMGEDTPALFTTNDIFDIEKAFYISDLTPKFVKDAQEMGRPIIVSCLKRVPAMQKVNKILSELTCEVDLKPFIIDDEGDQASLDTAPKKPKKSGKPTPKESPTYVEIKKMKDILKNPMYLAVTATPQANIFQPKYSALTPASIHLIQPGSGYDGAVVFHMDENSIFQEIKSEDASGTAKGFFTQSLRDAINYFIVASSIKRLSAIDNKDRLSDMIIHSAKETVKHKNLYDFVYDYLELMKESFEFKDESYTDYIDDLRDCYDLRINESVKSLFPFDDQLISSISKVVNWTGAIMHNGPGKKNKDASKLFRHRIYIGADLLQRGLTFKNLIVTHFVRWASSGGNMDTNLQRARWFGYREKYIDLCKMFTTAEISQEYSNLADIELDLWEQFADVEAGSKAIKDIIISAEDTKQKPTSKAKGKYKEVVFKRRWVKQRFIVTDETVIVENNKQIDSIIAEHKWDKITIGSRQNKTTGQCALFKGEQLSALIDSITHVFDMEPFQKNAVKSLFDQNEVPVILMWEENEEKRYRSLCPDQVNRIKALQQGANSTVEEKITYEGDSQVIKNKEKVNIQIYNISPGLSFDKRTNQDQYMFAFYIPKNKSYFVKADEDSLPNNR